MEYEEGRRTSPKSHRRKHSNVGVNTLLKPCEFVPSVRVGKSGTGSSFADLFLNKRFQAHQLQSNEPWHVLDGRFRP